MTQAWLKEAYERRVERILALPGDGQQVRAVAVVGEFDLAMFVRSSADFAACVDPDIGMAWQQSFTRTIFLAGDPHNLVERQPAAHLADDGSVAWYGPDRPEAYEGLSRLLRPLSGPTGLGVVAERPEVPLSWSADRSVDLVAVTSEVSLEATVVHINHLVAEAVLTGALNSAGAIKIRTVEQIDAIEGECLAFRVAPRDGNDESLRCFGYLRWSE
ncbi:DUF6182 family protein [Kribbella sindirgiensis]|uniref:Uncharacterized protein n=1 Tax=Kribbella sindirgiensis TaxID=1124744 RepID=A0A4R0IU14_9ACTN|nr:DUF6182 family protein [Kribbella sindirgiensis]TCC34928.1 hypothetical protein E0H50_13640 [Kribbella sindirgiensis]